MMKLKRLAEDRQGHLEKDNTPTFWHSALEVCYENALYKFTFDIWHWLKLAHEWMYQVQSVQTYNTPTQFIIFFIYKLHTGYTIISNNMSVLHSHFMLFIQYTREWSPHTVRGCCCCDSPAALLLSSVVQVEEVCDCSRVVPQVLHYKLCRMALTVEQMFYGVWCHSTLRTNIWYAAGDAGLVTVQKPTVTRTQPGESGTDRPRQQTFKRWDIRWWSSKDSGTKFVFASTTAWLRLS